MKKEEDSVSTIGRRGVEYRGTPQGSKWLVMSALKTSRMLLKGCVRYLASIVDTTRKVVTELVDVRVVCKSPDVFLEEFPELPSDREIKFEIELLLGTAPMSKAPYPMALAELKELKQQL